MGSIFKGHAVREDKDSLTHEDKTIRCTETTVISYQPMTRSIPQKQRPQLSRGES